MRILINGSQIVHAVLSMIELPLGCITHLLFSVIKRRFYIKKKRVASSSSLGLLFSPSSFFLVCVRHHQRLTIWNTGGGWRENISFSVKSQLNTNVLYRWEKRFFCFNRKREKRENDRWQLEGEDGPGALESFENAHHLFTNLLVITARSFSFF